jgi:hypothetical protein
MSARDLRPVGPIDQLDRALLLVRRSGRGPLVRSLGAGSLVALVPLVIYWLERVEGVRGLRPAFALALVAAFALRALALAGAARTYALALWPAMPLPEGAGRAVDIVRTALVVAAGLWVWSWLLVAASLGGGLAVAVVLPFFSLRGAVAPTWLARAACTRDAGLRAFARAASDAGDRRVAGVGIELCVLLAVLGLTLNFAVALALLLLVLRSYLGLDVAFVDQFLSADNTFALLATFVAALVAVEPLRAALSAVGFVDARVRQEGLDLRALVDEAIDASRRDRRGAAAPTATASAATADAASLPARAPTVPGTSRSAALVLFLAVAGGAGLGPTGMPARAAAQDAPRGTAVAAPEREPPDADAPASFDPAGEAARDDEVRDEVARILARREFQEFSDSRAQRLEQVLARFFEWLFRRRAPEPRALRPAGVSLPSIPPVLFAVAGLALLVAVVAFLAVTNARRRRGDGASASASAGVDAQDLRERPPEQFLDDAARLAHSGRYRDALRALYLATLVALDRRRIITFDPHLTNWQYLRQMARGEARAAFAEFTRAFDHKWYGVEPTTEEDYLRCRALATRIVEGARESAPPAPGPGAQGSSGRAVTAADLGAGPPDGPPRGLGGGGV